MQTQRRSRFAHSCRPLVLGSISALAISCASPPQSPFEPTADCFRDVSTFLASDEMEGRGIGTEGLARASQYLVDRYGELELDGLRLGTPAPSFRQPFSATIGVHAGEGNRLEKSVRASDEIETTAFVFREDFIPFGFSSSGDFEGEVVFVGYGIEAEELKRGDETFRYDDYEGVETKGRIALAMRYEPQEDDAESPFDGKRPSRFSDLRYKALKAREAGAIALIFFSPPGEDEDRLPRTGRRGAVSEAGIPVLQVKREIARGWLEAVGEDLDALHKEIDATLEPRSRTLVGVTIRGATDINTTQTSLANIVGAYPGRGSLAGETVVVGAHFDHLGYGGPGSLDPDSTAIHNGADDNASGVATMLCAVAELKERFDDDDRSRRTLVVAAFNGEETGLLGSNYYVRNAPRPIENTVAMVNLDMVGRLRDNQLHAMGTDSSPDWASILDTVSHVRGVDMISGGDGHGPSDQMSFYGAGVPVVHFFTGSHGDYHTPADDIELLNFPGGRRVTLVVADTLGRLLLRDERLAYASSGHGPTMAGDSRGFGAYLGTVPDYADMRSREGGVLLSSVRPGAPADVAGIRGGDRIIEIDETKIQNLHDMTFVLRDHRPGEIVDVVVVRDGEELRLRATLGSRGKRNMQQGESPHGSPGESANPHGGG